MWHGSHGLDGTGTIDTICNCYSDQGKVRLDGVLDQAATIERLPRRLQQENYCVFFPRCVSHLENAEPSDLKGAIGSGQYSIPPHVMHRAGAGRLRAAERKFLSELRLNKRRKIDW